jgi:hypothetical protein
MQRFNFDILYSCQSCYVMEHVEVDGHYSDNLALLCAEENDRENQFPCPSKRT